MPETLRCPGCHSRLPADAPEGLCPECLLKQVLQSGTDPGEGPGTTTPYPFGSAPAPLRPEDLAPHFPQLEILALLGQGGMGVVYKARQVRLDRLVALKILPPELGRDPAFAERFAREARAMARLAHPRIVGVHDFGQSGGFFYILMEFVDGLNLRGLIRKGQLKPEEALRIVPQVCEALQYAHDEGIIHRDIKPENILLDRRGNVKIADFGLAKLLGTMSSDSVLTGSRQVMGTLRYMAPEQMDTPLEVDHRADIYSLGVVFYEMLTGELPMGRFAPPSKKAQVDVRLDEVVFRALEKEPDHRYQHVSEVKTDVDSLSIPPGRLVGGSDIGREGTKGRDLGTAARLQASLVLILISAVYSLFVFTAMDLSTRWEGPGGESSPVVGQLVVMLGCMGYAFGVGGWAWWQFVRGGRSRGIIRLESVKRHHPRTLIHELRTAGIWRETWLLIPSIGTLYIIYFLTTARLASVVGAVSVGLWVLWQCIRGSRAWTALRQFVRERVSQGWTVGRRAAWRQPALIGAIYALSFLFAAGAMPEQSPRVEYPELPPPEPVRHFTVGALHKVANGDMNKEARRITNGDMNKEARRITDGVMPEQSPRVEYSGGRWLPSSPRRVLSGCECFILKYRSRSPSWLANPLLWLGCLALLIRRWLLAGILGLTSVLFAESAIFIGPDRSGFEETFQAGYWMWLVSMMLLTVGGFYGYGWWSSGCQSGAGNIKTSLPEIDPPRSGLTREFDDF